MKYFLSLILLFSASLAFSQTKQSPQKKSIEIDLTGLQIAMEDLEDFNPQSMDELIRGIRSIDERFDLKIKYKDNASSRSGNGVTRVEEVDLGEITEGFATIFSAFGKMIEALDEIEIDIEDN